MRAVLRFSGGEVRAAVFRSAVALASAVMALTSTSTSTSALVLASEPESSARQRRVRTGRRASLRRSAGYGRLRCGARSAVARHNSLRALRALLSDKCRESVDEARCARRPQSSAPHRRRGALRPARTHLCATVCGVRRKSKDGDLARVGSSSQSSSGGTRGGRYPAGGDFWSGEERRAGVGARSAHQQLTRRSCLNEMSKANGVSSAARPWTEHRSAVGCTQATAPA